jgi:hypothetical protein
MHVAMAVINMQSQMRTCICTGVLFSSLPETKKNVEAQRDTHTHIHRAHTKHTHTHMVQAFHIKRHDCTLKTIMYEDAWGVRAC